MKSNPAQSVDAHLKMVPEDKQLALENLRKIIKASAPETTEVVSYRIPIFKYQGHPLVGSGQERTIARSSS